MEKKKNKQIKMNPNEKDRQMWRDISETKREEHSQFFSQFKNIFENIKPKKEASFSPIVWGIFVGSFCFVLVVGYFIFASFSSEKIPENQQVIEDQAPSPEEVAEAEAKKAEELKKQEEIREKLYGKKEEKKPEKMHAVFGDEKKIADIQGVKTKQIEERNIKDLKTKKREEQKKSNEKRLKKIEERKKLHQKEKEQTSKNEKNTEIKNTISKKEPLEKQEFIYQEKQENIVQIQETQKKEHIPSILMETEKKEEIEVQKNVLSKVPNVQENIEINSDEEESLLEGEKVFTKTQKQDEKTEENLERIHEEKTIYQSPDVVSRSDYRRQKELEKRLNPYQEIPSSQEESEESEKNQKESKNTNSSEQNTGEAIQNEQKSTNSEREEGSLGDNVLEQDIQSIEQEEESEEEVLYGPIFHSDEDNFSYDDVNESEKEGDEENKETQEYKENFLTNEIKNYTIRGNSMMGIFSDGDTIEVQNNYYESQNPQKGDIILYRYGGSSVPIIKQVYGIEGDTFALKKGEGGWNIYINDEIVKNYADISYSLSEYRAKMLQMYERDYDGKIPSGAYLILGTNPSGTNDSTKFGLVHKSDFLGKVVD